MAHREGTNRRGSGLALAAEFQLAELDQLLHVIEVVGAIDSHHIAHILTGRVIDRPESPSQISGVLKTRADELGDDQERQSQGRDASDDVGLSAGDGFAPPVVRQPDEVKFVRLVAILPARPLETLVKVEIPDQLPASGDLEFTGKVERLEVDHQVEIACLSRRHVRIGSDRARRRVGDPAAGEPGSCLTPPVHGHPSVLQEFGQDTAGTGPLSALRHRDVCPAHSDAPRLGRVRGRRHGPTVDSALACARCTVDNALTTPQRPAPGMDRPVGGVLTGTLMVPLC